MQNSLRRPGWTGRRERLGAAVAGGVTGFVRLADRHLLARAVEAGRYDPLITLAIPLGEW